MTGGASSGRDREETGGMTVGISKGVRLDYGNVIQNLRLVGSLLLMYVDSVNRLRMKVNQRETTGITYGEAVLWKITEIKRLLEVRQTDQTILPHCGLIPPRPQVEKAAVGPVTLVRFFIHICYLL